MDMNAINLDCVICLEVASEAMECQECACIMCKLCSAEIKSCPLCRKNNTIKESAFARKMINNMPSECKKCGFKATICDLKYHQIKCPLREIKCGSQGCKFEGIYLDFVQHIGRNHEKELIDSFDSKINISSDSVLFENGTKSYKMQSSTFLYTFTSLNRVKNCSIKILIKKCKSPGHICVGFSEKRISIAKGYLGGDLGKGNWCIAGNGSLGEEGKWNKGMAYKENDIVTLNYYDGIIGYSINGISTGYTYHLGKRDIYFAATMYNLGDQIDIM